LSVIAYHKVGSTGKVLFWSLLFSAVYHLEQYLACNRYSVNIY
jgi:hypothetical protein